jgi:hypothetical protein
MFLIVTKRNKDYILDKNTKVCYNNHMTENTQIDSSHRLDMGTAGIRPINEVLRDCIVYTCVYCGEQKVETLTGKLITNTLQEKCSYNEMRMKEERLHWKTGFDRGKIWKVNSNQNSKNR